MTYLVVILSISYAAALAARKYPIREKGLLGQNLPNPVGFVVPAILFTVFSGLRNEAGDTFFIIHSFNLMTEDMPAPQPGTKEILSAYFEYFMRQITEDAQLMIFLGAVLSCVPVIYTLYKCAAPYELAIFLYVATTYFTFSFSGMGQYMAAGIALLGSRQLFSQKKYAWLKFAVFILLAYGFHSSAIIMIPVFFVVRRKAWSVTTLAIIFGSVVATILFDAFLPQFLNMVSQSDFSIYNDVGWFTQGQEKGSNIVRVFVVIIPLVIAYFSKEKFRLLGKTGDILINLGVINCCFYIISLYNWIFARFAVYTGIYFIILTAWIVRNCFKLKDRKIVYISCMVLFWLYFLNARYSIDFYGSAYFKGA